MKFMKRNFSTGILSGILMLLFCALPSGCVELGNYATLRVASGSWATTVQTLIDNWEAYDIYYAGLSYDNPSALMFDPKTGGRRLISDKWVPVTEKSVLVDIIDWLNANVNYPPTLWKILGPKGNFFGYMYTSAVEQVVIKEVDDKTLWVDNIPLPPIDYGGDFNAG